MPVVANNTSDAPHKSDESRHLRETTASIRLKAQRLRRSLDADRLDDAIKIAADVAAELRSAAAIELSPKGYYDVYLSVCAELRLLEMYVMESARRGAPVLELYERVQETPLVLPRLYLLITAGSVYVKSQQAPAKDVLRDLVEMCAGVQHPQRGLFLRAYLAQMMKDKLPDTLPEAALNDTDIIPSAGTVQDSIDFVIRNFTEMNRLWVRMQNVGAPREVERREKERLELRLLVGSNVSTLSRLVGGNLSLYRDVVLPAVLEQIVSCKDAIAQEYLADCVAQVFPDDFQLATLESFMAMCGQLIRGVNMRTILVSIVDRLTRFAKSSDEGAEAARAANAFHIFRTEMPDVMRQQGASLVLTDRLRIYQSLMSFALCAEPDRSDYIDHVLGFCVADIDCAQSSNDESALYSESASSPQNRRGRANRVLSSGDEWLVVKVLTMPLETLNNVGAILKLENYVTLQRYLTYENQKALAGRLLVSANEYDPCIRDVGMLGKLFQFVSSLVRDEPSGDLEDIRDDSDEPSEAFENFDINGLTHHHGHFLGLIPVGQIALGRDSEGPSLSNGNRDGAGNDKHRDPEDPDFEHNQELVARIVYLCEGDNIDRAMLLYSVLRQELLAGGVHRLHYTLPSLVFASLRLVLRCGRMGTDGKGLAEQLLTFAGESVDFLGEGSALLALRLRLHIAGTAASLSTGTTHFVYDNIAEAFVSYEQEVAIGREQNKALELIIGALRRSRDALDKGAFEALSMRAVKHGARTLTRSDQCVLLSRCALLFPTELGEQAMTCIRKAISAAECCVSGAERVMLLLDVVSVAVRLQEEGVCDVCQDGVLGGVLKKIREIVSGRKAKVSALGKIAVGRYQRIVNHIRSRLQDFETLDMSEL